MTRDLRVHARQTYLRLIIGFILILFFIGDGLIYLFYGRDAAWMGLLCLMGGSVPLIFIALILKGFELIVERTKEG